MRLRLRTSLLLNNHSCSLRIILKTAFPILIIISGLDSTLLPWSSIFLKPNYDQNVVPNSITLRYSGLKTVSTVISNLTSPKEPKVYLMPIKSTRTAITIAAKNLKNKKYKIYNDDSHHFVM